MDAVFDAQYLNMKAAFAREGIDIQVAYAPDGEVDYIYQAGQLLALDVPATFEALEEILPRRLHRVDSDTEPGSGAPVVLSIGEVEGDYLTVPDALDRIDRELADDNPAFAEGGVPLVTPVHILHITKLCPATEPVVPSGYPTEPWPAPCPPGEPRTDVRIGVSDTGLLQPLNPAWSWLAGVTGDDDPLGPVLPDGLPLIPEYTGHGTFVAGVARCMAPTAGVRVNDHFWLSGGQREDVIIQKLEELIASYSPHVINLSAGTYTRNDWAPLSFFYFQQQHEELTLVAAAGNDATDRPFYPAALDWPVAVGALGTDQQHRAWFSNYGDWVDVYALGEGLVNAYATGEYIYQEPPKRPARQTFNGMASWSGTSFSTPLVAGLIAAEIARTGASPAEATGAVLGAAQESGIGPVLHPCDVP